MTGETGPTPPLEPTGRVQLPATSGPPQLPEALQRPQLPESDYITEVRRLRAMTHPVRVALLEALAVGGPQTATEAAERIGESPTTCSFHLRQLAKYGFVEEAGGGMGRSRPWMVSHLSMTVPDSDEPEM
ncbi:MAG TPA: helix-turn-helix domain-containing protein, partial [Solirubrobacteraceae bacterium]|nr:helix-turn-helix domain-containing protein [Solirubrobacteraceae bacterium]